MSTAQNEYIFQAYLPAFGYSTYYFQAKANSTSEIKITVNKECILGNEVIITKQNRNDQ